MENLYIYIKNDKVKDILKYGMKLSIYADIIYCKKKGITAFLAPKDNELYYDENYTCIRIKTIDLKIIIYNKIIKNSKFENYFCTNLDDYELGSFEDPIAIIFSTILPENIFIYNKIQDIPILIENSKQIYYKNFVATMLEDELFSDFEIYQVLLLLGERKKIFKLIDKDEKIKIYKNIKNSKLYTKKSSL